MDKKPVFSWIMTGNARKYILLIGILAFLIIPQLVNGGTTGIAIITGNVVHISLARFTVNVSGGTAPLTVMFTDGSTGVPASWNWDFGDRMNATEQNPVHTFSTAGTYMVTLNVTNATGNISTASGTIIVAAPAPAPAVGGGETAASGLSRDLGSLAPAAVRQGSAQLSPPEVSSETTIHGTGSFASSPLSADLSGISGVTVAWTTTVSNNPAPGAHITTIIRESADKATLNRFSSALHLAGSDIGSLAYIMILEKTGISSSGPATVTMTVPQDWVTKNGGIGSIQIVRMADDGMTEVLTTEFTGYNHDNGYMTFTAKSPRGLSTFGLISVKSYIPVQGPSSDQMAPLGYPVPTTPAGTPSFLSLSGIAGIIAMLVIIGSALLLFAGKNK